MLNLNKITELGLTVKADSSDDCCKKIGIKRCPDFTCETCGFYVKEHAIIVSQERDFDCSTCEHMRELIGIDLVSCAECKEKVIEYLEEDFKKVFNDLKEVK